MVKNHKRFLLEILLNEKEKLSLTGAQQPTRLLPDGLVSNCFSVDRYSVMDCIGLCG